MVISHCKKIITDSHKFRLKKAMAAADKRSLASLQTSLSEAYDMEEKIKGGLMPPQLAMELFIAGL